jgi:hypothetical protein
MVAIFTYEQLLIVLLGIFLFSFVFFAISKF